MSSERKLVIVIEPTNPYLVSIKDLAGLDQFIQIFSYKTMLDIIGEAVELHFNNELNEYTLSDAIEELILSFKTSQCMIFSFEYMPHLRLIVMDRNHDRILNFNMTQFINLIYWQVQRLIADYLISPLQLKTGERVFIDNTTTSLSSLQFVVKVVSEAPIGHSHANLNFY